MIILGIETSCDETSAALVKDGHHILSNVVATSLAEHSKYGGIIPEIASRRQLDVIKTVVHQALKRANTSLKSIDAVAVTHSPGLIGSLLVGLSFARALSFAARVPLIEVDHIKAHLYANFLYTKRNKASRKQHCLPALPAVGLIVSGGHTSLYYLKNYVSFSLMGETRDDAAGEAFDKVAKILDLGYPGGPAIDLLSKKGKNSQIKFRAAEMPNSYDFSFSGVKTAVLYHTRKTSSMTKDTKSHVAYAFQDSVVSILVKKSLSACLKKKTRTLLVGGGVAANSELRRQLTSKAEEYNINVFFPPMNLCIDNAAMTAGYGCYLINKENANKTPKNQLK